MAIMVLSIPVPSLKKVISLPQAEWIAIFFFGKAHSVRRRENPSKIRACVKLAIGWTSELFQKYNNA
jgi:hypothetical protein